MKLNLIPTFQQGGAYAPPYAVYEPLPTVSQRTAPVQQESSSSGSSKDLTDKDLLEMLEKLDGLPSDMAIIHDQLQNFYINNAKTRIHGKPDPSNIAVRYINVLNQLKVANFNKKEYDNAYNQVSKNGGINEIAINDRGQFICVNEEGDFKLMTAEQLKESEGYVALTNSELLYRRAQDKNLANNNQLLSVVQNGISMEVVTKQIQDALVGLGTSETSQQGYISTQQGRVIQGLQDFENAVQEAAGNIEYDGTVNDLYKHKFLTKTQAQQANEAMAYIYNTLTPNARALLKAKSDLTETGAKTLLQTLVASKINNTQHFEINLEDGVSKSSNSKTKQGSDDTDLKSTQLIEMVKSISGVRQPMTVDRGDGIQMTLFGRQFNLVTKTNGDPIEHTSLANMLSQSGIQGIVKNMQNITFGDQRISLEDLKNITYNNTGVMRANLPIKPDGSVNFDLLEAFQKAEIQLEALGRKPTASEVQEVYESVGLTSLLKADGSLDETKFGDFLVTEGYTTDSLSKIKSSTFVKEFRGNTDQAIQIIQDSLKVGTGKNTSVPEVDTFNIMNPFDWFGNYDTIYKAAVYIPIDNSTLLAARLDRQKLDYDEALKLEAKYQYFNKHTRLE